MGRSSNKFAFTRQRGEATLGAQQSPGAPTNTSNRGMDRPGRKYAPPAPKVPDLQQQLADLRAELAAMKDGKAALRVRYKAQEVVLAAVQAQAAAAQDLAINQQQECDQWQARANASAARMLELEAVLAAAKAQLSGASRDVAAKERLLVAVSKQLAASRDEVQEGYAINMRLYGMVDALGRQLGTAEAALQASNSQCAGLKAALTSSEEEGGRLRQDLQDSVHDCAGLKAALAAAQAEVHQLRATNGDLTSQLADQDVAFKSSADATAAAHAQLRAASDKLRVQQHTSAAMQRAHTFKVAELQAKLQHQLNLANAASVAAAKMQADNNALLLRLAAEQQQREADTRKAAAAAAQAVALHQQDMAALGVELFGLQSLAASLSISTCSCQPCCHTTSTAVDTGRFDFGSSSQHATSTKSFIGGSLPLFSHGRSWSSEVLLQGGGGSSGGSSSHSLRCSGSCWAGDFEPAGSQFGAAVMMMMAGCGGGGGADDDDDGADVFFDAVDVFGATSGSGSGEGSGDVGVHVWDGSVRGAAIKGAAACKAAGMVAALATDDDGTAWATGA